MRAARALGGSFNVFGSRVPRVVGLLIGLTLGASILASVAFRNGMPGVLVGGLLLPRLVWAGEIWRLVTWVFLFMPTQPLDGLNFIFALLMLWWFGGELAYSWGPLRFLAVYLGFAAAAGGATCLLALLWPGLTDVPNFGPWALVDALIIAWAALYPHRDVAVFFMLPLHGRNLIYATVGGTLLFALLYGVAGFIPHFMAEGLMLAYIREPSLYRLWLRLRLGALQRSARRHGAHLRPVDRDEWGKPPRWLH